LRIELQPVYYIPKELKPGVLYVSEEFGAVAHLCPCGCGSKIRTPLGPTEWALEETETGPTLIPSIGNWQQECRSHYWIYRGEILWASEWTPEQVDAGYQREKDRRRVYYETLARQRAGVLRRFLSWARRFLRGD
jgi:hypothetical protein